MAAVEAQKVGRNVTCSANMRICMKTVWEEANNRSINVPLSNAKAAAFSAGAYECPRTSVATVR